LTSIPRRKTPIKPDERFGSLVAVKPLGDSYWRARCDSGHESRLLPYQLRNKQCPKCQEEQRANARPKISEKRLKEIAGVELRRRLGACRRLGVDPGPELTLKRVMDDLREDPDLFNELWEPLPKYDPAMSYIGVYGAPILCRAESEG
jgi:hypothetical protein